MSEELKNKLKQAREKLGLTQAQFAERIEVSYRTLVNWENDLATPRGLALKTINEILDRILSEK